MRCFILFLVTSKPDTACCVLFSKRSIGILFVASGLTNFFGSLVLFFLLQKSQLGLILRTTILPTLSKDEALLQ